MIDFLALLFARTARVLVRGPLLARMGISLLAVLLVSATALGEPPAPGDLERRIASLTPDVCIEHTLGEDLRLKGYSVSESVGTDREGKRIQLDQRREFSITLFFEQLRIEANHYQVLLRWDDIPYDPRTGLSFALAPFQQQRLPVYLSRGQIDTLAGQAGGTIRLTLRVRLPYFITREDQTDLKLVLIMPDGAVTDSRFLDHFEITYSDAAPKGSENVRSAVSNPGNLLGNPSFEDVPHVNTPGNWTCLNKPGLMHFLDWSCAAHGLRSLQIEFFGGLDPHAYSVCQEVSVRPDTDYELSWYVKSDEITSKAGPRFFVYDAEKGWAHFEAHGEQVLGTTPWHRAQFTFHTPQDTAKLVVALERRGADDWKAAPKEGALISGSVWFDLVELVEKGNQSQHVSTAGTAPHP